MDNKGINVCYQNVRGLRTKCLQLYNNILINNYDIIILTETWLHAGILDGEICDARYEVYRRDRSPIDSGKSLGGGVLIATKQKLGARYSKITQGNTELLWVTIPARNIGGRTNHSAQDLHIAALYIPPDPHMLPTHIDFFLSVFDSYFNQYPHHNYLLIGDFNLPCIQWDLSGPTHAKKGSVEVYNAGIRLTERTSLAGLTQFNLMPNHKGNILDLVFSNLPLSMETITYPLVQADDHHPAFSFDINDLIFVPLIECRKETRNFRKANYDKINQYLSEIDWTSILNNKSTNDSVEIFYSNLNECISTYVPQKISKTNKYPIWFSQALIKINKEKNKIHKRWKKYKNPVDYDEFSLLRSRERRVRDTCFQKYTLTIQNEIKSNPKKIWSYVKNMRGSSNYPKSMTYGNVTHNDGQSICDAFNNFFYSVFGTTNKNCTPSSKIDFTNNSISRTYVSPNTVKKHLIKLDINKGAGSDEIPQIFWHSCADTICVPISNIFNKSLNEGIFPDYWKKAHIVPIHKQKSKNCIENYRGISILNTIGKVFEKIIYDTLYPVVSQGIPSTQHGFLKKRSTVTNLACFSNYIVRNMERGGQVDVIYTDFEKAFDRVDHVILLHKLQCLGIHGDLLRWLESYLSNRSQAVVLGGYRSEFIRVPTGIPQGSHLGPLLYNVYLYDIINCFKSSSHLLYADDKKLYSKIQSLEDCYLIQNDLNTLYKYYLDNNIVINISKCQCISFTRKTKPFKYQYKFNNLTINRISNIRDLGVVFDQKMLFSEQIDAVINKAYSSMGFVLRSCKPFNDPLTIKTIYMANVRSILEYASPVWSPQYIIYKNRLERIQRIFINHMNYRFKISAGSYKEGCRKHNLMTLEERRSMMDMCFLYDLLRGNLDSPELLSALNFSTPRRRSRHTSLLNVPMHFTNYTANSIIVRISRDYNKTFSDIDPFECTKSVFKKRLKNFIFSRP